MIFLKQILHSVLCCVKLQFFPIVLLFWSFPPQEGGGESNDDKMQFPPHISLPLYRVNL